MKLLLVGADNAVGRELIRQLQQRGIEYIAPGSSEINVQDPIGTARVITRRAPDQVINLASFAADRQLAVQLAEQYPRECAAINHEQSSVLAQVCDHLCIPLIQLSTVHVFSGGKKLAYSEQDRPGPVGVYGETALAGEQEIARTTDQYVILRTGWLFGLEQDELIRQWLDEVRKTDGSVSTRRLKFSPTPVEDVARVILAITLQLDCDASVWGVYHYCSLESRRESEFVRELVRVAARYDEGIYGLLDHLTVDPARISKPDIANGTLACKKIFDTFAIKQRPWHGSLEYLVKSYFA